VRAHLSGRADLDRIALALPSHAAVEDANLTPFQRARAALHVGATPDYLPCRDVEYAEIEAHLEDAIEEGVGLCHCACTKRLFVG